MADEQFAESGALLAIIAGNEDRAIELIKDMLTGERLHLHEAAERLAALAHPGNQCPKCGQHVDRGDFRSRRVGVTSTDRRYGTQWWHGTCYEERD